MIAYLWKSNLKTGYSFFMNYIFGVVHFSSIDYEKERCS